MYISHFSVFIFLILDDIVVKQGENASFFGVLLEGIIHVPFKNQITNLFPGNVNFYSLLYLGELYVNIPINGTTQRITLRAGISLKMILAKLTSEHDFLIYLLANRLCSWRNGLLY